LYGRHVNPTPATAPGAVASLGMYPLPHVRAHWDRLWTRIAAELPGAPATLAWERPLDELWRDPALLVGVTCGWPLVTQLTGVVAVIGTFDPAVPWAAAGRYRSVLVASKPMSIGEWRRVPGAVVAVNGTDSLSGWVSLCDAWGGAPEQLLVTGAHLESLRTVARGDAQVASIDAVTFELAAEDEPMTVGAVHVIGHGPVVPALPIVTAAANAERVPALRAAIDAAVGDPAVAGTCAALRIRAFVAFDRSDYDPLHVHVVSDTA
jgi:ABC-type phosphate/phosphonate transport system substrate-binding protein